MTTPSAGRPGQGLKENQIPGLVELKRGFEARLAELEGYSQLQEELETAALNLVRQAVERAGVSPLLSPPLAVAEARASMGPEPVGVAALRAKCGFCTNCITDCVTCVFGASRVAAQ
jgi:hypothetical protein